MVACCAQPPVQVLGLERRAVAGGSGDQQVPARPEAAPDLAMKAAGCGRCCTTRIARTPPSDASAKRSGALTSCMSNVTSTLSRAARVRATSTIRGDQLTMLRLVASPLPGRALAVVHEPKEPARGSHGGDATAGGCSTSSRGDARGVPEVPTGRWRTRSQSSSSAARSPLSRSLTRRVARAKALLERAPCANPCTKLHARGSFSVRERASALVAGAGFEPATSGL